MNLLTVKGLTKRFGSRIVLQDVGFNVKYYEILGLIGPNGAGKTTLFECLSGILPSDGGTINARSLRSTQSKAELFYLPDGITPWAQQSVHWALRFFEKLYESSITVKPGAKR